MPGLPAGKGLRESPVSCQPAAELNYTALDFRAFRASAQPQGCSTRLLARVNWPLITY